MGLNAGPDVGHWDATRDGPLSETALRGKLEGMGYTVHRYTYPPGTFFPDHSHALDKIDAVLKGRFRLTLRGYGIVLEAGDWLAVPAGAVHSAEVVGAEPVVSLDAVRSR
ncbi:MAG: cupin domain-containing protein [Chromatiales bacterium]